jgi:hypothetical protein
MILSRIRSRSYVTTDGQSASLSRCQAPSGPQDQIYVTFKQLRVCWCGVPSLTGGRVCRLQMLLAVASAVILESEFHGTHDNILRSQIRDSPNLEGQVPVFISPRDGVTQLHPQTLGSLFVPYYESRGYSGGIRARLHRGYDSLNFRFLSLMKSDY